MFPTSRNRRQAGTNSNVEPPPPGSDSCFGVRSLNGSVQWSPTRSIHHEEAEDTSSSLLHSEDNEGITAGDTGVSNSSIHSAVSNQSPISEPIRPLDGLNTDEQVQSSLQEAISTPVEEREDVMASPSIVGRVDSSESFDSPETIRGELSTSTSPIMLLPSLSIDPITSSSLQTHLSSAPPSAIDSPRSNRRLNLFPDEDQYSTSTDTDISSAPPSPASVSSLNSMPSYLASSAYMSRMSSPIGYPSPSARSTRSAGVQSNGRGQSDLVIPELSLPSSSLHLSLREYEGVVEGVKIGLIGNDHTVKGVIRELGERVELVKVNGKPGQIGIIRNGKVVMVLCTGLSRDQMRSKIIGLYQALHSLLNPSSSTNQAKLRDLAKRYAEEEEWIHAVHEMPEGDHRSDNSISEELFKLIHRLPIPTFIDESEQAFETPSVSTAHLADPTPMALAEMSSYFSYGPTRPQHLKLVEAILASIDSSTIRQSSIDSFLSWRPAALESSASSVETRSPVSNSSGMIERQPMPTVVRAIAQGGGEWEAGLSRRIAKRRELEGTVKLSNGRKRSSSGSASGNGNGNGMGMGIGTGMGGGKGKEKELQRGRQRRKKSNDDSKERDTPLFPREIRGKVGNSSGVGIGRELFGKTFGTWRRGWRGWTGVVLAAVVVGVMGFGIWIGSRE